MASDFDAPPPAVSTLPISGAERLLGISLLALSEESAAVSMVITDQMANGFGTSHGGIIFALADTAFAYACNSRGGRAVAFHCSITFVEPGAIGATLVAVATEVARAGRSGIYDVRVTTSGRTVAEFRGHSRHLERNPDPDRAAAPAIRLAENCL